eukprot:14648728-Alexandrium_andersonii.AAC.1
MANPPRFCCFFPLVLVFGTCGSAAKEAVRPLAPAPMRALTPSACRGSIRTSCATTQSSRS